MSSFEQHGDAGVAAFADYLEYTLTVALERIAAARRKRPSGRSLIALKTLIYATTTCSLPEPLGG